MPKHTINIYPHTKQSFNREYLKQFSTHLPTGEIIFFKFEKYNFHEKICFFTFEKYNFHEKICFFKFEKNNFPRK
jgi:hypothetical protein